MRIFAFFLVSFFSIISGFIHACDGVMKSSKSVSFRAEENDMGGVDGREGDGIWKREQELEEVM